MITVSKCLKDCCVEKWLDLNQLASRGQAVGGEVASSLDGLTTRRSFLKYKLTGVSMSGAVRAEAEPGLKALRRQILCLWEKLNQVAMLKSLDIFLT